MTELQRILLAVGYLGIALVYVWWISRRAENLVEIVREGSPDLWEELGAPASMRDAVADPERRWIRFMRTREYRTRCDPILAERIDSFRRLSNATMFFMAVVGAIVVYFTVLGGSLGG